jgi:pilus assembly protein Flp/PilA
VNGKPQPLASDVLGPEVFGVLARTFPSRLIEISRSGCLLESAHPVDSGTVAELSLEIGGEVLLDDLRVTRCVRVEGAGGRYLIGGEFVQTRRAAERSIRRAVTGILRGLSLSQFGAVRPHVKRGERAAVSAAPKVSTTTREGVMKESLARFIREDEGQDLIEYGLLAGIITTLVVAAITSIGGKVLAYFTDLDAALPAGGGGGGGGGE